MKQTRILPLIVLLLGLCLVTLAPALNNGFIADDYVFLEGADTLKTDPLFLFGQSPLNYRTTTFLVFLLLKSVVGYTPTVFYGFTILIHAINCALLWKLLLVLGRPETEAYVASILFAVFHGPQEAVVWLVAMGEALQGLCLLVILILWLRKRFVFGLLVYFIALFTKESAPLALVLVGLAQWQRKERIFSLPFLGLLLLTAAFGVFFIWMWTGNSFIQGGAYAFGPQALRVLAISMHRLLWPWFYILFAFRVGAARWMEWRVVLGALALIILVMSPYIFLTYASALPSRHLYLASIVLCGTMAYLLAQIPAIRLRQAFIVAFAAFNIGFFWVTKDAQFEGRAVPTTALLDALRMHPPTRTVIQDFAYPFPQIPKAVTHLVPGWSPDLIDLSSDGEVCNGCLKLRWDPQSRTYTEVP